MRKLKIGIVILVVIGFPLVSWIYLNSGLQWRIDAQEATESKGSLGSFALVTLNGDTLTQSNMAVMFYIFGSLVDSISASTLRTIHEQFAVRSDYRTISMRSELEPGSVREDLARWLDVKCLTGCEDLSQMLFTEGSTAVIVDDSLRIRGRYTLANADDVRALIRHTAVVLPIEKREKLELKRGINQ
jgi:hypothetical protein